MAVVLHLDLVRSLSFLQAIITSCHPQHQFLHMNLHTFLVCCVGNLTTDPRTLMFVRIQVLTSSGTACGSCLTNLQTCTRIHFEVFAHASSCSFLSLFQIRVGQHSTNMFVALPCNSSFHTVSVIVKPLSRKHCSR